MRKRELIFTSEGTFIKLAAEDFKPTAGELPASLKEIFAKPIKISSDRIELNDQGGYVSEEVDNYGYIIHPSAIVCAEKLYTDETREIKMPDGQREPEIREGAILCEGVELRGFQHIEQGVFIGENTFVDEFSGIARDVFIGAGNYIDTPRGIDYKVGAFSIIGDNNRIDEETNLDSGVVIGSQNKIGAYGHIGHGTVIHDNCEFEKRVIVPPEYVIKSKSRISPSAGIVIKKISPGRGR